jgi:23S rRNA (adenine-N6)-dimethyltransferase
MGMVKKARGNRNAHPHVAPSSRSPGPGIGNVESVAGNRRKMYGQNFFRSAASAAAFTDQLEFSIGDGHLVEIGPGSGRITAALARRGFPVTAVEIDAHWQEVLAAKNLPGVEVVLSSFLDWEPPARPVAFIGNLPFGSGTQILRRCLEFGPEGMLEAVFLMQREYVWKRVGRYGGNLFNAQWWPWYSFHEGLEFPRQAFEPMPNTHTATLFVIPRREGILPWRERDGYQDFVAAVYNTGHADVATALQGVSRDARSHLRRAGVPGDFRVKELHVYEWVEMYLSRPQH